MYGSTSDRRKRGDGMRKDIKISVMQTSRQLDRQRERHIDRCSDGQKTDVKHKQMGKQIDGQIDGSKDMLIEGYCTLINIQYENIDR
jgi:hypothetical protein